MSVFALPDCLNEGSCHFDTFHANAMKCIRLILADMSCEDFYIENILSFVPLNTV